MLVVLIIIVKKTAPDFFLHLMMNKILIRMGTLMRAIPKFATPVTKMNCLFLPGVSITLCMEVEGRSSEPCVRN